MKNLLVCVIVAFPLFVACQSEHKKRENISLYSLNKVGTLLVDKQLTNSTTPYQLKTFLFDNKTYLTYYDQNAAKIFVHLLDNDSIHFIDTVSTKLSFKRGYITDYTLISLDTFLLAFNPAYSGDAHDTLLCMINKNGRLISTPDFGDLPVITNTKKRQLGVNAQSAYPYFLTHFTFPLTYHKQLKCVVGHFGCMYTICGYNFGKTPNEMHAALLHFGKPNHPISGITFDLDSGLYYSLDARFARGAYNENNGSVVFSFGFNNTWQVMDTNLNIKKTKIHSYILDTIYPLKEPYNEYFDYSRGDYSWIRYNRYLNEYYRFIRVGNNVFKFPNEGIKPTKQSENETYLLQIVDSNLVLKGEAIFPKQYNPSSLAAWNDKIILLNKEQSVKSGRLTFDIMRLNHKQISLMDYKIKVREQLYVSEKSEAAQYLEYASQIYDKKYVYNVFINVDAGCMVCKDGMFTYLKENIQRLNNSNISITLITTSRKNLLNKLGNPTLPDNVFIDSKLLYKKSIPDVMYITELSVVDGKPYIKKHELSEAGKIFKELDKYLH